MPRYAETLKLLERDLSGVSSDAAVKNIEMWEESLAEMDSKEGKALVKDLGALKKELAKDKPNGEQIATLMGRLGEATVASADQAPEATAEKLRAIGEALSSATSAGEETEAEDEESDDDGKTKSSSGKSRSAAKAKA